jgi:GTP-binding protein
MLPVIALVGRPNVGKSTLFNRLTRSRDALVADEPGLTRDRQYGIGKMGERPYVVVDTGGLARLDHAGSDIERMVARQVLVAVDEADGIVFLVDVHSGATPLDVEIAVGLRRLEKPVFLLVNKADRLDAATAEADFHGLGLGRPQAVSAAQGRGVAEAIDLVLGALPAKPVVWTESAEEGTRIAVVGRPNVGKSTLINRMLGEPRVLVCDEPGTTRDSIAVPFTRDGSRYVLVDTAGVRRRARVHQTIEKFSVIKTLQSIDEAHVILLVIDAREGVGEQDARLLGHVIESGRALVLVINKWDGLSTDRRARVRRDLDRKLLFVTFAERHFISALHGSGVGKLFPSIERANESAHRDLPTPQLTRILIEAVAAHPPPLVRGRRIKLRYAHQGGERPPVIVIHGNQTEHLPASYQRYLVNVFREALGLRGTPVRVELRTGENPYRGRKNSLTPRQAQSRKRLLRHVRQRR